LESETHQAAPTIHAPFDHMIGVNIAVRDLFRMNVLQQLHQLQNLHM
jgi:hypothetical protein